MNLISVHGVLVAAVLSLAGCKDEKVASPPPPANELTAAAVGHYCGMRVLEHTGPKAQIILASRKQPIWFSSARDAFSFTMLPEEPKDIRAIYVSDMAKAPSWEKPGPTNWVDAKQATFVISSRMKGGMGADEAVPFSSRDSAEKFATENGGRLVSFADMPREYILGSTAEGDTAEGAPHHDGNHPAAPAEAKKSHSHH